MESGVISGYGFQAFFDRTLTSGCSVGIFCVGTPEVLAQSVDVHPSFQLLNFIIFSELYWTYCCRFSSSKYGSPGMFGSVLRVSKQGKRTSKIICSEGPAFDLDLCC